MYKNYEDKLNTILSNAKGEKVEKIELALIDDLENSLESLEGITKDLKGDAQIFKSLRNRVQNDSAEGEQRVDQIQKYLQDLQRQAKELGFNAQSIPAYKRAGRVINDFRSLTQGRAKLGGLLSL
tara:strand:- start:184 stop:558 length:375 start_codon:yes stop_codon:yes gene_type:complete